MLENRESPEDISTSEKLFGLWLEKLEDKPGLRQDDSHDLKPHATLLLHVDDIEDDEDQAAPRRGRALRREVTPTDSVTINRLEEDYPTECYNQGKLAKQMQKYFMCMSLSPKNMVGQKASEPFRVTSETYQMLLQNYTDQYSCYTQNVETNVCVCPSGYMDVMCSTDLYTRCYMNITDPPFYAGCENEYEDSFYYLYSIPGFTPCFWHNFNSSIELSFEIHCQQVQENGLTTTNRAPKVGYPYRDVIREPNVTILSQVSSLPEIEFTVEQVPVNIFFDFRDMKYISNKKRFQTTL